MTTRVIASKSAEFLPVKFAVYRLLDRDLLKKEGEETKVVAKKGMPDYRTRIDMTLQRCVIPGRVESVGAVVERMKKMLEDSKCRFTIMSAQESDDERKARYERDGLEVVTNPIITPAKEEPVKVVAINDDDIIPSASLRVTKKRKTKGMVVAA